MPRRYAHRRDASTLQNPDLFELTPDWSRGLCPVFAGLAGSGLPDDPKRIIRYAVWQGDKRSASRVTVFLPIMPTGRIPWF
jgi:hypothetical protein